MKKLFFLTCFTLMTAVIPMACTKSMGIPTTPSVPTPTPTPVCGYTALSAPYVSAFSSNSANADNVIQNATQWTAVNAADPVPTSVNFSAQMVLEYVQTISDSCNYTLVAPAITSVCFYSDHIEVTGTKASCYLDPGYTGPTCNNVVLITATAAVAVPQSTLPVVWDIQ